MSPTTTEYLRTAIGLPSAPIVLSGLDVVANYFDEILHEDPSKWVNYLKGIDFHHPVSKVLLAQGHELIRHMPEDGRPKPFLYFTDVGESPMRTGTNFPAVIFERYCVTSGIWALRSRASSISFSASDRVNRPGGAIQYILPAAQFTSLKRIT